ncbi:hypothetical protein YC2023_023485 [Brassica napus]
MWGVPSYDIWLLTWGEQVIPAEEQETPLEILTFSSSLELMRVLCLQKQGFQKPLSVANLYMESGADASFVEAPRDDDELKEIGKRTKGYRLCNMLESELKDPPLTSVYASIRPLVDLREKGTTKDHYEKMILLSRSLIVW